MSSRPKRKCAVQATKKLKASGIARSRREPESKEEEDYVVEDSDTDDGTDDEVDYDDTDTSSSSNIATESEDSVDSENEEYRPNARRKTKARPKKKNTKTTAKSKSKSNAKQSRNVTKSRNTKSKKKTKSTTKSKRKSSSAEAPRQRKSMSVDTEDEPNSVSVSPLNEEEKMPEAIVTLHANDYDDASIRPDPRLFDILNDNLCDKVGENDINKYLRKFGDRKIKTGYFKNTKHGQLNVESVESIYLRREAMNEVMVRIEENIDSIIENADRNIFNDIVEFAQNAYRRSPDGVSPSPLEYLWDLKQHILPTAMLMCGQNVSDHPLHFEHLQHQFESKVTPLVVRFSPNDLTKTGSFCSKMNDVQKFIVHSLFHKLSEWKVSGRKDAESGSEDIDDGEYVDMNDALNIPKMDKIKNEILRTFVMWYFEHGGKVKEFWKHNEEDLKSCFGGFPKIILMIDSIEQWSPMILSSLIYTLHGITDNYKQITSRIGVDHIPFILVLGVSTTEDLLSRMIEPDALRLLSVSRHYFEPSHKLYQQLAEQILIESSPILFDCSILNKLLNHYQLNDYSVARFKDQIRYLFMSYFMNTKASQYAAYFMYLRSRRPSDDKEDQFYRWWFDSEQKFIGDTLAKTEYNEGDPSELWMECLDDAFAIYQRYRDALRVFKLIIDTLDLRWTRTEIIAKLQDKELLYKYLLSRVGAQDSKIKIPWEERNSFPNRIEDFDQCHEIYRILEQNTKTFDAEFARKAVQEHKRIEAKLDGKGNDESNPVATVNVNARSRSQSVAAKRKNFIRSEKAKTKKDLISEGRHNLFKLMQSFIEKHLKPMNELPLHEIFVHSKVGDFSADMFPPNAGQIRRRLLNSHEFMVSQSSENEEVEPEALGCIYQFYSGCSTMYINLHDAYITFKERFVGFEAEDQLIEKKRKKASKSRKEEASSDEEDEGKPVNTEREKLNQITFRMSIDDLRFCGFLKATNRRKEALMKMAELL